MSTLADLVQQKEALEQQIAAMRGEARAQAIAEIKAIMAAHELTQADISGKAPRTTASGVKTKTPVAAKYRDNQGNKWSGRGLKPKWLAAAIASGKKLEDFGV